ncbi:Mitochondrial inner membrane protein 1 [Madurella fahalii]|uniref:Mitochondrial inner membrane protein 1 n=1 Tax=Madurella fahalii TaxID=1157608 RepID=A0ABQ0GKG4_9PEZI
MLSTTLRTARPSGRQVHRLAVGIHLQTQRNAPLTMRAFSLSNTSDRPKIRSSPLPTRLPCTALHITQRALLSTKPPLQPNKIDKEFEKKAGEKKLESRPDEVTSSSSVRQVVEESQAPPEPQQDVMEGLKGDVNTIKETLALSSVPREAFGLGLAGTLPYLATSVSTVYLSWALNTEWPSTSNFINSLLVSHESATYWLQLLEPIQVGYGAVIISFLGAIHWGLEFAEKKASLDRTRFRYGIGVIAPAVAWPTIFMPIQWALVTQFLAFVSTYFVDSRATTKGWAPAWYGTYRFVLTAVVGAALLISLVGRAKVGEGHMSLSTGELMDRIRPMAADQNRNWAKEEEEEKMRIQKEKEEEEEKRKQAEKKAKEEKNKKEKAEKSG